MLRNFTHFSNKNTVNEPKNHIAEAPAMPLERKPEEPAPPRKSVPRDEGNMLIVGPNIKLKGSEITDCEILVVEGRVEASMNSRDIRIAEGGVFSGKAEIDVAEVRGLFEGDLTARRQLVIYASGKVTGKIRYGALTIEEGGELSGEVASIAKDAHDTRTAAIAEPIQAVLPPDLPKELPKIGPIHASSVLGRTPLGSRRN